MTNFLIAFQATEELTEGLALALGLGAVQRGGNIRLRHLTPAGQAGAARLAHQGYGRIKGDDVVWAECLAVGVEAERPEAELEELLTAVRAVPDRGGLRRKRAVVFGSSAAGVAYVGEALRGAGIALPAEDFILGELSPERMMSVGNRLADTR